MSLDDPDAVVEAGGGRGPREVDQHPHPPSTPTHTPPLTVSQQDLCQPEHHAVRLVGTAVSLDDPDAVVEAGGGGGPREVDHAPALHGVEGAAVRQRLLRPRVVWWAGREKAFSKTRVRAERQSRLVGRERKGLQ